MKPGQYKLTAQAFYRQDGSDEVNYPYLFVGDAKSYFPERSGTENNMPDAYASFLAGTYPVDPITFVVSSESDNVTIGYANANVKMWNIFGQTQLTYYGTALINDAIAFNNGGVMTAGQWYYFDATVAGTYEFSAGSDLTAISYTTDGTQVTSSATGTTLTASQALSATRYYFKSSSAQTLTVSVPAGAQIINADIDFSNEIVDGIVAGEKNSMTIGKSSYSTTEIAGDAGNKYIFLGYGENTVTIPVAERPGNKDIVTFKFDLALADGADNHGAFYIKDADGGNIGYMKCALWSKNVANETNLGINMSETTFNKNKTGDKDALWNKRTSFIITLNYLTHQITTVSQIQGGSVLDPIVVEMTNTKPVAQFVVSATPSDGAGGAKRRAKFGNLVITNTKGDYSVSDVNYTVIFVDGNGTKVKVDDTSRIFPEGTSISDLATPTDMTTFYNDGDIANNTTVEFAGATNKYVYKSISAVNSSEEAITELEAGAIVTIVYDRYNKYNYAVKQKLGDAAATDKETGTLWEDQTYSYYFPVGVKDGDDYYFTEANGSSPYYKGTLTSAQPTVTINYTLDPMVVFYAEGEDLASKTGEFAYYPDLMADGSCGVLNSNDGNLITNLSAGIYTITARTVGRGDGDRKIYFYKSSVNEENIVLTATPNYTSGSTETSAAFALTDATNILVKGAAGGGANGNGLDYVIIKKFPDTVSATIGEAGWATLYTPYALDFSSLSSSFKAYTATVDGTTVTLTEVSNVPANTGVVLNGATGNYNIPVIASSSTAKGDLTGNATEATAFNAASSGYAYYVLAQAEDYPTHKIQFRPVTTGSIAAGKAFLEAPYAAGVKALNVVFNDIATGVDEIAGSKFQVSGTAIYNVAGQRVSQPTRGLYIKNGKKIIIK